MTFYRPLPTSQLSLAAIGGAFLWGCAALVAPEAYAACDQFGSSVDCTGVDADGFRSPQTLTVRIRPGAFVQNQITNETLGLCPLSFPAIQVGTLSSVLNEGAISTGGVCGFGIQVTTGASVVNIGSIRTADFFAHGIIAGNDSSVRNAGSISTLYQGSPGISVGRNVRVVTDAGSRIITDGAASSGVEAEDSASITHNGEIIVTGDASIGLDAGAGSVLVNTGRITTSANNSMGVRIAGGSLTNSGSIRSVLTGLGFALTPTVGVSIVGAGASVTNTSSGTVTATHIGIRLSGTQGASLSNSGLIDTSPAVLHDGTISANGAAVLVAGGFGADISNGGSIVARGGLPALLSLGPHVNLTNSGSIVGDVILSAGNDSIALEESSSIDGSIDMGAGDDTLLFRAGGVISRPILNAEFLSKSGGSRLTFGRDVVISKQINVFGGSGISIDRGVRLIAPITDNIGLIRGHGTLAGALDNSGTVAPGTDTEKGTLTVTGAFRQFQTGRVAIRISPDGTSDKLLIGGPATLAGGLAVTYDFSAGGDFRDGQRFDVIAPVGASLVSSGELTLTAPQSTFLVSTLLRSAAGGVVIEIDRRPYETAGVTDSQRGVGRMLDRLRTASSPGLATTFVQLEASSPETATAILAGFAPEAPGGVQNLSLMALDRFADSLRGHASAAGERGRSAWARGFTSSGRSRGASSVAAYDLHGGAAGVDMAFGGVNLGVAAARIEGDFARGSDLANYDASILGLTARYRWSEFDVGAAIAYGTGSPRLQRARVVDSGAGTFALDGDVGLWSATFDGAMAVNLGPALLSPHAGLTYHRASLDGLDEQRTLAVETDRAVAESLRGRIGVGVSARAGRFRPYGDLSMSVELLGRQPLIGASLIGVPGSEFELAGDARRRSALEAQAGIAVTISPKVEAYVAGEIAANDLLAGRSLMAGLTFRW